MLSMNVTNGTGKLRLHEMEKHRSRRLYLLFMMTLLGAAAGFAWGHWSGYDHGKADTMKAIERRLNAPKTPKFPV